MKLICINGHSKAGLIQGKSYDLLNVRKSVCNCSDYLFDVGLTKSIDYKQGCYRCGVSIKNTSVIWFKDNRFSDLPDNMLNELVGAVVRELETIEIEHI